MGLGCVLPALCCIGTAAVGGFAAFNVIKKSPITADVMVRVTTSARAAEALGTPVSLEGLPMGNIEQHNDETSANLTLRVRGSRGRGTVFVEGTSRGTAIDYTRLELETEKGEKVDLREAPTPRAAPEPPPAPAPPPEEKTK